MFKQLGTTPVENELLKRLVIVGLIVLQTFSNSPNGKISVEHEDGLILSSRQQRAIRNDIGSKEAHE